MLEIIQDLISPQFSLRVLAKKSKLERERMISEISQSSNQSNAIISELNLSSEKLQIVRENIKATAKAAVQEI